MVVLLAVPLIMTAQDDYNKDFVRQNQVAGGLNFKLMPALYWDCVGLEVEYPISDIMSVGLNILGQAGRTDAGDIVFKVRPEYYQQPAWRAEFALKYYLSSRAPIGFYVQANASYGNLLFFDGTNRPFTMHSRWKKFDKGLRAPVELERPLPFSTGIGAGYQLIIIPKKIVGNIMIGTQLHLSDQTRLYPALYLSPSLGLLF